MLVSAARLSGLSLRPCLAWSLPRQVRKWTPQTNANNGAHRKRGWKKKSSKGIISHGISSRAAACVSRPPLMLCIIAPIYIAGEGLDKPSWCCPAHTRAHTHTHSKKILKDFSHLGVSLRCGEEGLLHGKTSIINRLFSPSLPFSSFHETHTHTHTQRKRRQLAQCCAQIWSGALLDEVTSTRALARACAHLWPSLLPARACTHLDLQWKTKINQ